MKKFENQHFKELFLENSREHIDAALKLVNEINGDYSSMATKTEVLKLIKEVHSIKGSAGFIGFMEMAFYASVMENIFIGLSSGDIKIDNKLEKALEKSFKKLKVSLKKIERSEEEDDLAAATFKLKELSGLSLDKICSIPGRPKISEEFKEKQFKQLRKKYGRE